MDADQQELMKQQTEQTVAEFLMESFKALINPETEKYLKISSAFREELEALINNLEKSVTESNFSLSLGESLNSSTKIINLINENIEETPRQEIVEKIDSFRKEILPLFNISLDRKYFDPIALIKGIFKKREPADLKPVFRLNELIVKSLEENRDKLNIYLKSISDLLLKLWQISDLLIAEIDQIAHTASDEELSLKTDIAGYFDEIDRAETNLKEAQTDFLKSVADEVVNKQKAIASGSLTVPPGDRKNRRVYNSREIQRSLDSTSSWFESQIHNWHNTFYVMSDDWMLELEIARLKYYILKQHFDFGKFVDAKFIGPLGEQIAELKETAEKITALLKDNVKKEGNMKMLKSTRTETRSRLFHKLLPATRQIIIDSNVPARIDEFEKGTAGAFKQLSESRTIKKKTTYDVPTELNELEKISPRSLVSFQMMPDFMKHFPLLKQAFIRHLQEVQNRFEEIPEIIDFSLTSAQSFYEEKDDIEEAENIGIEGVQRAINKIEDVESLIKTFRNEEVSRMKESIEQLAGQLTEITDNENAVQIRMRIAKARALEKSKQIRNKIFNSIRDFLPRIWRVVLNAFKFIRESSIRISKQFILENKRHFVATDVSDYLTETEKAINRLPFIYQRLFKTEPLTSFELYIERTDEIEQMKKAYSRWKAGKFAPTVIISEKGWGKTTLVNRFFKLKLTTEEVKQINPDPEMSMDELYNMLIELTPIQDTSRKDQEKNIKKKIIVLDGLEKLFEARINGFDDMLMLLQHISDTNHYVFWIVTCHLYAWDYLEKTLEIADFFGYHVKLPDLSDEELMKTIERRHNISGYRLVFLPDKEKKSLISFKKQPEIENQDVLKAQYFSRMHRIVKGNLSQAFLFWMRSTSKVTEDSVYIDYISNEFFNFLGSMTDSKLMILKNIVIHNGITAHKHASLFRIKIEKSRLLLQQLYDDGIIVKTGQVFNINPIIYRQVIGHLYLLNILH